MKTIKELKQEFNNITLIKIFEIEVINKETQDKDYIIFNLSIQGNNLVAQHEALTIKESKSKQIAFKKYSLDDCLSIDENLQELYNICIDAIIQSDFYALSE